jgi:hypothetical protein
LPSQFGTNETTDRDAPALARELNQRAVLAFGLDADPGRGKFDLLNVRAVHALHDQKARTEVDGLPIGGMARVDHEGDADGEHLDQAKGNTSVAP